MKTSTTDIGRAGEEAASKYLLNNDFEIVSRNYRWARGEIDIIAKKEDVLIFIEVKTATGRSFGSPESWVDERKQRQIGMTAEKYLADFEIEDVDCRFDVIAVTSEAGQWRIQHIEDAFWLEADSD